MNRRRIRPSTAESVVVGGEGEGERERGRSLPRGKEMTQV